MAGLGWHLGSRGGYGLDFEALWEASLARLSEVSSSFTCKYQPVHFEALWNPYLGPLSEGPYLKAIPH